MSNIAVNALGRAVEAKASSSEEIGSSSVPGFLRIHTTTAARNLIVDGACDSMMGARHVPYLAATAKTTGQTISAAELLGGIITADASGGAVTLTTPTAAQLVAAIDSPYLRVGHSIVAYVMEVGGTNAIAFTMGSGITEANASAGVAANTGCVVVIVFTNVTSGSEAATWYLF